jgi:hypothetical protein
MHRDTIVAAGLVCDPDDDVGLSVRFRVDNEIALTNHDGIRDFRCRHRDAGDRVLRRDGVRPSRWKVDPRYAVSRDLCAAGRRGGGA